MKKEEKKKRVLITPRKHARVPILDPEAFEAPARLSRAELNGLLFDRSNSGDRNYEE